MSPSNGFDTRVAASSLQLTAVLGYVLLPLSPRARLLRTYLDERVRRG